MVAGFLIWRAEHRSRLGQATRLKLMRLVGDGERAVAALALSTQHRGEGVLRAAADLTAWWDNGQRTVKAACPDAWEHFADLGELHPDTMEEQARLFVQRIRDVLTRLERSY